MKSFFAIVIFAVPCCLAQNYPPLTVYAGTPFDSAFSGDGGQATSATFANPWNVAVDTKGNLYIADDCNNRVRKVDPTGVITTVAGSGNSGGVCNTAAGYSGDGGPATAAVLKGPTGVAVDSTGIVYISDSGNQVIRKVDTNGIITTFAGGGTANPGDGGPATSVSFSTLLSGLAVDTAGNLYVADGSSRVRKITPGGTITTVAGGTLSGYTGDGGLATQATLSSPAGVAVDASGNVYIADTANCVIRKVSGGFINTVAGTNAGCGFYFDSSGDGGPATSARLNLPWGVAVDSGGNIYIAVPGVHNVREVLASSGMIQTVLAPGENYLYKGAQSATPIREPSPYNVAVSGTSVYVPDQFYQVVWVFNGSGSVAGGAPAATSVSNAFGSSSTIAANTWVTIKGSNLAPAGDSRIWQGSDFAGNQLPTALDRVSVAMNGEPAFVYYISPTQLNILTPPDLAPGPVQVQITANGQTSASFTAQAQTYSPSLFVFNGGPYVTATHSNGSIVGPTTLYPGASTPAQAGEEIVLYANGFGATSSPVVKGSETQSGTLPSTPLVQINGASAQVIFAGLVSPGVDQFNVIVPTSAAHGDDTLSVQYNGQAVQSGVLLTVQ